MPSIVRDIGVENLLSGRRLLITWALNLNTEGVSAYEIWRAPTVSLGFEKIGEVNSPINQYVDKVPFTFGVNYYYKVLARDGSGLKSSLDDTSAVTDSTFDSFEEVPFRSTSVTFDSFINGETPTGVVNSSNTIFQTLNLYRYNTVRVYINGLRKKKTTDFTENVNQRTLTFVVAPTSGAVILVDYLKV